MGAITSPQSLQWILLVGFSLLLFAVAPMAKRADTFFRASSRHREVGFFLLTSSLVISWIFAKSITNAANLGLSFGFVGGVAYAVYYLSFLTAGWIIYRMRVRGGFGSIHEWLSGKYGRYAVLLFSVLIAFRLFNEVWSNTMVIGTYFGEKGSSEYLLAIVVFTVLTLAYVLKGGLRSSLLTDAIQMALFGVLLFIILGILLPKQGGDIGRFVSSGTWSMSTGLNLLLVATIQIFSYPFHDPVVTDRGFIAAPKTTLRSFFWAVPIGVICILLFSFVGIHARLEGLGGQAPVEVAKTLGTGMMLLMNLIMVTSAASTLDSTFASFSKLTVIDLKVGQPTVRTGRIVMVVLAVAGTLPILISPEILSATTISGTMVLGLAPVFLFWNARRTSPWSFILPVLFGIACGTCFAAGCWPEALTWSDGKYGDLLSANIVATIGCFLLFYLTILMRRGD